MFSHEEKEDQIQERGGEKNGCFRQFCIRDEAVEDECRRKDGDKAEDDSIEK